MRTLPLDLAYVLLALVTLPVLLPLRWLRGKRLASPRRRLGFVPPPAGPPGPVVWFHAVSVGETLALRSLVEALRRARPEVRPVITCTTTTGLEVARSSFRDLPVLECPYDLGGALRRFVGRVRPAMLVLVEVEFWPNMLGVLRRRGIPVLVVNGRLSARSARGYRWLVRVMPRFLAGIRAFLVQETHHAERLRSLGIPEERIQVAGNLKADNLDQAEIREVRRRLRREHGFAEGVPVLVAGSTHPGEEESLLDALERVRKQVPDLRLVLVPRHPERTADVLDTVRSRGLRVDLRSRRNPSDPEVLLVDTLGELSTLYGLADITFVGGTLVPVGGHNLLEPAAHGLPVLTGPHLEAVRGLADELEAAGVLTQVTDAAALARETVRILEDPTRRVRAAEGARMVLQTGRGATERTLGVLLDLLDESEKERSGSRKR